MCKSILKHAKPNALRSFMAICLAFLFLLCLAACAKTADEKLTLAVVSDMAAAKGEALTWSDFSQYPSVETGSGLYILVYEIDADYRLMIGGVPQEPPMYIYLVSVSDAERRIDIRYDDVDAFLRQAN